MREVLSLRQNDVLSALINEYMRSAAPVASKTICDRYELGVSSATVRNELAGLETRGYAMSPHTSAGRVPTDDGYRVFVDGLIENEDELAQGADIHIQASQLEELFRKTCVALARLTRCLAVLLAPSHPKGKTLKVALAPLSASRVLAVEVAQCGDVRSVQIQLDFEVSEEDVECAEAAISHIASLPERMRSAAIGRLDTNVKSLVNIVKERLGACPVGAEAAKVHRHGMAALLSQPEFSSSRQYVPLTRMLEDDSVLSYVLMHIAAGRGLTVRIGHENEPGIMQRTSLVARGYGAGTASGVVALIGPTRMDYASAIGAVDAAAAMLEGQL